MRNSLKLFSVMGIPIEINISWLIIFGLVIWTLSSGYFPAEIPDLPDYSYLIMGILSAILVFICLLLHELSHSIVARRNKIPISGITLFIFGGVAHMGREPQSPNVEFRIAAAGPAMSFFIGSICFAFSYFCSAFPDIIGAPVLVVINYLLFFNVFIGVFNLLPAFPLDGGRIFRAIVWHFIKNMRQATYISSILSKTIALSLCGLGVLLIFSQNIVSGAWLLFLGIFLFEAAEISFKQITLNKFLKSVFVKDIMSPNVIEVPGDISISSLVEDYIFKYKHNCFPVMSDSKLDGIITFHAIKEIPKEEWHSKKVSEVSMKIDQDMLIDENAPIQEALLKIAQNQIGRLLIIKDNKLSGILSQKDIMKLFKLKEELD